MTAVDEEVLVDVDLEKDAPCEIRSEGCDQSATWAAVLKCCRASFPSCDQHKVEFTEYLSRVIAIGLLTRNPPLCGLCETPIALPNWVPL